MHTSKWKNIRIHYNSDYSGPVMVNDLHGNNVHVTEQIMNDFFYDHVRTKVSCCLDELDGPQMVQVLLFMQQFTDKAQMPNGTPKGKHRDEV